MIVILSGWSGERKAYTSVLSANGSSAISGASLWLEDIRTADAPSTATMGNSRHALNFLFCMVLNFGLIKRCKEFFLVRAVVYMASPVVSLTARFSFHGDRKRCCKFVRG